MRVEPKMPVTFDDPNVGWVDEFDVRTSWRSRFGRTIEVPVRLLVGGAILLFALGATLGANIP